jgi:hypothetical protein
LQTSSAVGRYYDPTTGQFISVDPDVASTGAPYAFVGSDPVNASDPTGMFFTGDGGQTAGVSSAGNTVDNSDNAAIQSSGDQNVVTVESDQAAYNAQVKSFLTRWHDAAAAGNTGSGIVGGAAGIISKLYNSSGNAVHLSDEALLADANAAVGLSNFANGLGVVGVGLTVGIDVSQHRSIGYTIGNVLGSVAGGPAGAFVASIACGAPEDVVGVVCGVAGAVFGGIEGGAIGARIGNSVEGWVKSWI